MIFILSTELQDGKGGISTALLGLKDVLLLKRPDSKFISSHGRQRWMMFNAAKKLLTNLHKNDIVWLHCGRWFSILRKFLLSIIGKLFGAKVVFQFHSQTLDHYLNHPLSCILIKFICWWADGIVVLTPWWRNRLVSLLPSLSDKIHVCPNSLDSLLLAAANTPCIFKSGESTRLLSMSRLVKGKGFEPVIHSLALLPDDYVLTIAGDGPLLLDLKALALSLGIEKRIKFTGWVEYSDKHKLISEHDVFVLPSKFDSFGMGYLEAMAFGLPVVALDFQAIKDVVPHGKAGLLCLSDAPDELSKAILYCRENKEFMSRAGKQHVLDNFINEKIVVELLSFFEGL